MRAPAFHFLRHVWIICASDVIWTQVGSCVMFAYKVDVNTSHLVWCLDLSTTCGCPYSFSLLCIDLWTLSDSLKHYTLHISSFIKARLNHLLIAGPFDIGLTISAVYLRIDVHPLHCFQIIWWWRHSLIRILSICAAGLNSECQYFTPRMQHVWIPRLLQAPLTLVWMNKLLHPLSVSLRGTRNNMGSCLKSTIEGFSFCWVLFWIVPLCQCISLDISRCPCFTWCQVFRASICRTAIVALSVTPNGF